MQGIEKLRQRWCGALRLQNHPYRKVLFSLAEFRVGLLDSVEHQLGAFVSGVKYEIKRR